MREQVAKDVIVEEDLANAVSAVNRGADRFKVYERIATRHPRQSADFKGILLYTPVSNRLEAVEEALFG